MKYNFCGNSGLQLPEISLGLWHNFGDVDSFEMATSMILHAFENGITHFDLANNYGPPPGSAETNFGKILAKELKGHRDELIISSKAGHLMWDGPYGDGGSRKYIMASIDQSLKRTGLEYFDIFYSHRYDPQTPVEETMQALVDIVRQGKALYVGISKYPPEKLIQAYNILKSQHVPCLIYQDKYSMLVREPEIEHMDINEKYGVGFIAFSPLAQGVLTNKYLNGIPEDSRAHKSHGFLQESEITPEVIKKVKALNDLAGQRGQTLAEMALAWLLHNKHVTSVIIGTSSLNQLKDNLKAKDNSHFTGEELALIEMILA
ncbi:MAG: aldo/keto reductase [Prevotella sp.]|jgi:L-glyceraldehyde 3-phosphate reductase|nr:aldo/keto reductase [Prevotella sp.]